MNFIIFLPLILITATSLILLFVIPAVFKQQQYQIEIPNVPPVRNATLIKTPTTNECAHGNNNNNQTLDGGIICLPNDTKLVKRYNGVPTA